jgi:2-polyprenyl-6-methoxyphenol hydroxylase-like FAD-dependent oxidoreductase
VLSRTYDPKSRTVSVKYSDDDRSFEREETADLLVVAEGAGADLRAELTEALGVSRTYAGYVAYRGTVEEKNLPEESRKVLADQFTVSPLSQLFAPDLVLADPAARSSVFPCQRHTVSLLLYPRQKRHSQGRRTTNELGGFARPAQPNAADRVILPGLV